MYIPEIDGLRFAAILMVILFHLSGWLEIRHGTLLATAAGTDRIAAILYSGNQGVQWFFVVSGFVLALPFVSAALLGTQKVDISRFYLRRLTRLEPPYILNLIFLSAVSVFLMHAKQPHLIQHFLASVFYAHNILYHSASTINYVAWSLEVEVQFYILVPLIAQLFRVSDKRLRRSLLAAACAAFAVVQSLFIPADSWVRLTLIDTAQYFLLGFLLADLYLLDWKDSRRKAIVWDAAALPALCALALLWPDRPLICFAGPCLLFLVFAAAFRGRILNAVFRHPVCATIGGMCYTIYLYHSSVISFVCRITMRLTLGHSFWLNFALQACLLLPCILVVCGVLFAAVERPCMVRDWPQRLFARFFPRARNSRTSPALGTIVFSRGDRPAADPAVSAHKSEKS